MSKKLLIAAWAITIGLGLLFAHAVYADTAPPIKVEGDVVTMDKATFQKLMNAIEGQQKMLDRLNAMVVHLESRYSYVEDCVRANAASGHAVTPCLNANPTADLSFKQYQRFKNNTVEY